MNKGEQIERLVFHARAPLVLMDRRPSSRPSLRPEAFRFPPCGSNLLSSLKQSGTFTGISLKWI